MHAKFILTELECATKVMEKASTWKYVVVLIGQERRTQVGLSPWAQVHHLGIDGQMNKTYIVP